MQEQMQASLKEKDSLKVSQWQTLEPSHNHGVWLTVPGLHMPQDMRGRLGSAARWILTEIHLSSVHENQLE